jgi:hypothetical protein
MAELTPEHGTYDNPGVAHEGSDVSFWGIIGFGIVLGIATILVHVVIYWLFLHYEQEARQGQPEPQWYATHPQLPTPEPRIEGILPDTTEVKRILEPKQEQLDSYGWIDQKSGVAHIPIQEAIKVLATDEKMRLSSRKPEKDGGRRPSGWQWPSGASSGRYLEEAK